MPIIYMSQESRQMKQFKKKLIKKHNSTHTIIPSSRDTVRVEQIFKDPLLELKGTTKAT